MFETVKQKKTTKATAPAVQPQALTPPKLAEVKAGGPKGSDSDALLAEIMAKEEADKQAAQEAKLAAKEAAKEKAALKAAEEFVAAQRKGGCGCGW